MPQFLVTARDGSDPGASARRAAARPAHLASVGRLGSGMILGGAMLDAAGLAVGSTMVVDFPDRAAVDAWIASDPYTTRDVWRDIVVAPFRVAVERGIPA